eukprot:Opistho-2@10812
MEAALAQLDAATRETLHISNDGHLACTKCDCVVWKASSAWNAKAIKQHLKSKTHKRSAVGAAAGRKGRSLKHGPPRKRKDASEEEEDEASDCASGASGA